ncbi:hypothetical protein J6590_005999 [Homalodisca vitripennis]|nr:hypothetical protein J6590_005999 [Homalodisca vitripennis]
MPHLFTSEEYADMVLMYENLKSSSSRPATVVARNGDDSSYPASGEGTEAHIYLGLAELQQSTWRSESLLLLCSWWQLSAWSTQTWRRLSRNMVEAAAVTVAVAVAVTTDTEAVATMGTAVAATMVVAVNITDRL